MSAPAPLARQLDGPAGAEVVLLLNGGLMTYAAWEPIAAALRRRYRTLGCDLHGQLLSPGEAHPELAGNVEDLVALLDELGLERVHLLGTSFGAEVGLLMAARAPDRVRSLAAVTATDYATPNIHQGIEDLRRLAAAARGGGDTGAFHDLLVEEVYSDRFRQANARELAERRMQIAALPDVWYTGLEGILTAMEGLDLRPELGSIACPTLVVLAAADAIMPPQRSRALAAAIPGARLEEHPSSGHALVAEDPGWLTERYLAFLASLEPSAAD